MPDIPSPFDPDMFPDVPQEVIFPALATAMMAVAYIAEPRVYRKWLLWQEGQTTPGGMPLGRPPSRESMASLVGVLMALAIKNMTEEQVDFARFTEVLEGWGNGEQGKP